MENTVANHNVQAENQNIPIQNSDDGYSDDVLVLSENGELVPAEPTVDPGQGERAPEPASGDDGQPTEPQKFYRSQQEVNAAFGARLAAEREKLKPDLDFTKRVRMLFNGMTDEQIEEKLLAVAASSYAEEKGIPVEVASELTNLRMNLPTAAVSEAEPKPQTPAADDHDGRIKALADEASEINQKYGIDMGSVLATDKDLQRRVFGEGESLKDVLIDYLQSQQRPARTITPIRSPNGDGSVSGSVGMSDEQYERIKAAVKSGNTVRLS